VLVILDPLRGTEREKTSRKHVSNHRLKMDEEPENGKPRAGSRPSETTPEIKLGATQMVSKCHT